MTHYWERRGHSFVQQSVKNVCVKFKVDRVNRFRTGARQLFTTQKLFPSKIPLTMKIATSNSLYPVDTRRRFNVYKTSCVYWVNTFSDQITICQISFEIFDVKHIDT